MDFEREKLDLRVREEKVSLEVVFPKLNREKVKRDFSRFQSSDPHQTILDVMKQLTGKQSPSYTSFLDEHGFYESGKECYDNHCHQSTPVLGAALVSLGFKVHYLESYRIRESFEKNGANVQVPPSEEPDAKMRDEFIAIKRIPYCCLEVDINGSPFYVSAKHIKENDDGSVKVVLSSECYRENIGVLAHPKDDRRSGIYLQRIVSPIGIGDSEKHIVWKKQVDGKDPAPELFFAYLRME